MNRIRQAALVMSVLLAGSLAASPAPAQDINGRPNYGTVNLRTGYTPDPHVVAVQSGGSINADRLGGQCRGFISASPDVRLVYSSGSLPLIISVASGADTTLVVNGPDGRWYCDDDGGVNGLNPSVRFERPQSGRYEIWVGTYGSSRLEAARLNISEIGSQ
jgi:hypothetical protein